MPKDFPEWFNKGVLKLNLKLIDEGWTWEEILQGFQNKIDESRNK